MHWLLNLNKKSVEKNFIDIFGHPIFDSKQLICACGHPISYASVSNETITEKCSKTFRIHEFFFSLFLNESNILIFGHPSQVQFFNILTIY